MMILERRSPARQVLTASTIADSPAPVVPAFNLADHGTPLAYYTADGSALADGAGAAAAYDRYGSSPVMEQATPGDQPLYRAGARAWSFGSGRTFTSTAPEWQQLHKGPGTIAFYFRAGTGNSRAILGSSASLSTLGVNVYRQGPQVHFFLSDGSARILMVADVGLREGVWYRVIVTWDATSCRMYVDGVLRATVGAASSYPTADSNPYSIGSAGGGFFSTDEIAAVMAWTSGISDAASIKAIDDELHAYKTSGYNQVFQRTSVGGPGVVRMRGQVRPGAFPGGLEARYAGGAWSDVTLSSNGSWSWVLAGVTTAQGTWEIRDKSDSTVYYPLTQTIGGAGSVIFVKAQSNGLGQSINEAEYTGLTWDTTHGRVVATGTLGTIYNPHRTVGIPTLWAQKEASSWPAFLTDYIGDVGVPTMVVVSGQGGTIIERFLPDDVTPANNDPDTNLYDQALQIFLDSQGLDSRTTEKVCRAIVFLVHENNANLGTSTASFEASLNTVVDALNADLGEQVGVMVMATLTTAFATAPNQELIRVAERNVRASNARAFSGPDDTLVDLTVGTGQDGVHYRPDTLRDPFGVRWSDAIQSETTL